MTAESNKRKLAAALAKALKKQDDARRASIRRMDELMKAEAEQRQERRKREKAKAARRRAMAEALKRARRRRRGK